MDRKRSRDPDDEADSPSGKRTRHEAEAGTEASFATSNNAMQAVAHEALAMTNGGGGFSAINSANRKIASPAASTSTTIGATATATATAAATAGDGDGDGDGDGNSNGNSNGNGSYNSNGIGSYNGNGNGLAINGLAINQMPIGSMSDITRCFQNAVAKAWDSRSPTYAGVHVLLVYWDEDDSAVKDAAVLLESVFRATYHFATDIFPIQSAASSDRLYSRIESFFAASNSPGDLAILYYAGEIVANRQVGEAPVWTPRGQNATACIESKPIQAACEGASCDVLLLFDFCNAYLYPLTQASYGMARRNVIEVLDAPNLDLDPGAVSFTRALAEELSAVAHEDPVSVEALQAQVADRMTVSKPRGRGQPPRDPQAKPACEQLHLPKHYFLFLRRSIVLAPLPAEPQIILCLRVLSGILEINEWGKWIYNATPEARDAVKIEGLHSGFATIIVLRVPVSEWALFSECPAGSLVGYTTVGDIDPDALDKIDKDLALKLWPEDAPPTRTQLPGASVTASAATADAADPGTSTTASFPATAGSTSPATPAECDMDGTYTSRAGQKRARKALPTERKILPSEPSPGSLRKKEYAPGDERKTRDAPHPLHGQSYAAQKSSHGPAVDAGDVTEKHALLAAAHKPFKISIKLAGQTHVCKECTAGFKDADTLQNHVRKLHTRPFHCVFHWAGCESTFASKNEWKRHVMSQHILLQYWVCQVEMCSKVINRVSGAGGNSAAVDSANNGGSGFTLPNGAIFNRKDLFTQHLRRMHTPPHVKKLLKQAKQGAKMPNHVSITEWENRLKDLQQDGLKPRCRLPDYMVCPAQGCGIDFHGNNAWDDRMEHVARHLEAASAGREPPVIFGGKTDTTLTSWATRPEVGIAKRVGPNTWHLDNPLRPEIMAWTEDVRGQDQQGTQAKAELEMGPPPGGRERSRSVIEVADEEGRRDVGERRIGRREGGTGIPVN